jgi:hypothetical protein
MDQEVITQEDLTKALSELETPKQEEQVVVEPKVEVAKLEKSAETVITEQGSENLKKALEVSALLKEVTGLMGQHVDASLETLVKGLNDAADRDRRMIAVLGELKKAIDANTAALEKVFEAPARTEKSVKVERTEVLQKNVQPQGEKKELTAREQFVQSKQRVLAGLETLYKSLEPTDPEFGRVAQALVMFESTGKIADEMLQRAFVASQKSNK